MSESEGELLYHACRAPFGLVVRGSAKAFRKARGELASDPGLVDLAVLGPDQSGQIWLVRKDKLRDHLLGHPT